jgi:hypothetical protein
LTIAVKDETRVYDILNPEFTITYTGFVYGETKAQLIAPAIATTTATEASRTQPLSGYVAVIR